MTDAQSAPSRRWVWPVALGAVTLLAFGLRWYYVSTAMVYRPIRGDAAQYVAYAWNLLHHGVFAGNPPGSTVLVPSNYRDPGYPLLLAFWMACFSAKSLSYAAVLMCQAVLGALTVTCAMQLGRRWLDWRWVTAAGALMAVWPHNIVIASDLLTETLFGFLCALAMLLCARACDRQSLRWAVAAGVCFGAAALTNKVLLPFGLLLALYLAWRHHARRRVWIALLVGAVVLPGAWAVRNSQLPTQAAGGSSLLRAMQNFAQGSRPEYHAAWRAAMLADDPEAKRVLAATQADIDRLQAHPRAGLDAILRRLARHPWHSLAWYTLEKPRVFWGWRLRVSQSDMYIYLTKDSPFRTQPAMRLLEALCKALNPVLAALMLAALVLALARRGPWRARPEGRAMHEATIAIALFATLVYGFFQSAPRYSIPFRSFEMLLAMTTLSALVAWLRKRVAASRQKKAQTA